MPLFLLSMLTVYLYSSMMKKQKFLEQCILVGRVHIKNSKRAIEKINPKDLSTINILFGVGISCEKYNVGKEFYKDFKNKFSKEIVEQGFFYKE